MKVGSPARWGSFFPPKPLLPLQNQYVQLLCELSLWPSFHFHSSSLEWWSQTSVSGTRSSSICCSGELSAEKLCLTPLASAGENARTAGCPTERGLECILCLRLLGEREKSLFGPQQKTGAYQKLRQREADEKHTVTQEQMYSKDETQSCVSCLSFIDFYKTI